MQSVTTYLPTALASAMTSLFSPLSLMPLLPTPSGVSVTVNPFTSTGPVATFTVNVTANSSAPTSPYNITLTSIGVGTVVLSLTPSFTQCNAALANPINDTITQPYSWSGFLPSWISIPSADPLSPSSLPQRVWEAGAGGGAVCASSVTRTTLAACIGSPDAFTGVLQVRDCVYVPRHVASSWIHVTVTRYPAGRWLVRECGAVHRLPTLRGDTTPSVQSLLSRYKRHFTK